MGDTAIARGGTLDVCHHGSRPPTRLACARENVMEPRLPRWPTGVCLILLALIAGLGGWAAWERWHARPRKSADDDPRLTFDTPYRNVRPDVGYVGDAVCVRCHRVQADSYRRHPMSRSMAPMVAVAATERYGRDAHNPFESGGFLFQVERRGDRVFHKQTVASVKPLVEPLEAEVAFVIGSGAHGRSYFVNRDGYLFQSPISWYSQKGVWDLSPSFDATTHFNRPVLAECLFCHANSADPVEHALNRYEQPLLASPTIGCERCHGPGALHARARAAKEELDGDIDYTIVNPARLPPALRESVCQQCHLQGDTRILRRGRQPFDFRPGLPLHLFWSVFVRPPELTDNRKSVSQVEQLSVSACFRGSGGELGCISCHDPHGYPSAEQRLSYFRDRCLSCHEEKPCTVSPERRRQQQDNCIACHMPMIASSNTAHTALTDHRILRRPDTDRHAPSPESRLPEIKLVNFYKDQVDPGDPLVARDLALARLEAARIPLPDKERTRLGRLALPVLQAAVRDAPDDLAAREGEAYALWLHGRQQEALAAYEAVLERAPQRETALADAAALAETMQRQAVTRAEMLRRRADAIDYWRRAVAVNPWAPEYHAALARLLAADEQWRQAISASEAALRLEPSNVATRKTLIESCLGDGDEKRARKEFEKLLSLKPPEPDELQRWFEGLLRASVGR
jgi:Flp pilus assembly protein TadD